MDRRPQDGLLRRLLAIVALAISGFALLATSYSELAFLPARGDVGVARGAPAIIGAQWTYRPSDEDGTGVATAVVYLTVSPDSGYDASLAASADGVPGRPDPQGIRLDLSGCTAACRIEARGELRRVDEWPTDVRVRWTMGVVLADPAGELVASGVRPVVLYGGTPAPPPGAWILSGLAAGSAVGIAIGAIVRGASWRRRLPPGWAGVVGGATCAMYATFMVSPSMTYRPLETAAVGAVIGVAAAVVAVAGRDGTVPVTAGRIAQAVVLAVAGFLALGIFRGIVDRGGVGMPMTFELAIGLVAAAILVLAVVALATARRRLLAGVYLSMAIATTSIGTLMVLGRAPEPPDVFEHWFGATAMGLGLLALVAALAAWGGGLSVPAGSGPAEPQGDQARW